MSRERSSLGPPAEAAKDPQALERDAQRLLEEAVAAIAAKANPADYDSFSASVDGFRVARGGLQVNVSFDPRELASFAAAAGISHDGHEWVGRDGTRQAAVDAIVARVLSEVDAFAPKARDPSWMRVKTPDSEPPDPSWMRIRTSPRGR